MDLKGIIAQHADPVARKHGTSWDAVLEELGNPPYSGGRVMFSLETRLTMADVYNLSILTTKPVLRQIYGFNALPNPDYNGVLRVKSMQR